MPYYAPSNLAPLVSEGANVAGQRNGTTAQAFRVYNTYTDSSNYEYLGLSWSASVLNLGTFAAGTGSIRQMVVGPNPTGAPGQPLSLQGSVVNLYSGSGFLAWKIDASQNLVAGTDASYDIGAAGATRPRNLYISGYIAAQPPSTQSGTTYTVSTTDYALIFTAASTCTVTLPAAASFTGRQLRVKGTGGATVVSASSNVVPRAGGAAGTAILAAAAGSWAELISDGTNWIIMAGA